ncbi:MAG: hypothetical protein NTZ67_04120 [Gammaproteobacteria bacterium]|nr:hypothetical protein [Gammaproteobacteria bacterium]
MAKYEALPTTTILPNGTMLHANELPELVHMDDPALSIMTDYTLIPPHTISPNDTKIGRAMETSGVHLLLVINNEGHFQGVLGSQDVWGEKPIKLIQENRIRRDQVLVKMIMVPYSHVTALDFSLLESARVGHIVKTLSENKQQYVLAVSPSTADAVQMIRGIFTASQISKQLHVDVADLFFKTESLR